MGGNCGLVKLAAVSCGVTASQFAREATLRAAAEGMKNFVPPTLEKGPTTAQEEGHLKGGLAIHAPLRILRSVRQRHDAMTRYISQLT